MCCFTLLATNPAGLRLFSNRQPLLAGIAAPVCGLLGKRVRRLRRLKLKAMTLGLPAERSMVRVKSLSWRLRSW